MTKSIDVAAAPPGPGKIAGPQRQWEKVTVFGTLAGARHHEDRNIAVLTIRGLPGVPFLRQAPDATLAYVLVEGGNDPDMVETARSIVHRGASALEVVGHVASAKDITEEYGAIGQAVPALPWIVASRVSEMKLR